MAIESGFMKRKRKLSPLIYLDLLFHSASTDNCSLEMLAVEAANAHHLSLSKQGVDNRFTEESISFSKLVLSKSIQNRVSHKELTKGNELFNRILIKDSTRFDIDSSFASIFPGYGGSGSDAGVSIQFECDLKKGQISDLELQSALDRDSKDGLNKRELIQAGDLIIRDLGYYHSSILTSIIEKKAYFISRLHSSCNAYIEMEGTEKLDFGSLHKQMQSTQEQYRDMNVFLGKERIPARLIITPIPEEVYEKRIRERNKKNKYKSKSKSRSKDAKKRESWNRQIQSKVEKGYNTSDEFKERARFNLFICNIPSEDLPCDAIYELYKTRWQIELYFKVWKSVMNINSIRKMKYERFVTMLYIQLLWIVVHWEIIAPLKIYLYENKKKLLSEYKCMKTLKTHSRTIRDLLGLTYKRTGKRLREIYFFLSNRHWLEIRKESGSYVNLYSLLFCKSTNYK